MRFIAALAAALWCAAAIADEVAPLPAPKGSAREKAIAAYNDGVQLLLDKRFADAQKRFEDAIGLDESLAEAHNNLAFALRMQGRHNYDRAQAEYRRALEINPKLAQAYVYRGVLNAQSGNMEAARADLATLRTLDPALAAKLEKVLDQAARDERDGISGQLDNPY
jgi:tetratricopeptide (TPR) repeat protein